MSRRQLASSTRCLLVSLFLLIVSIANAGVIFGAAGLRGGYRWDAAPRTIGSLERSLDGGLRYSVSGGSFEAFRDSFSWRSLPSTNEFQQAVEDAFNAWTIIDPATGLTTDLRFVADLATPVVSNGFAMINVAGAEIDIVAADAGDSGRRGWTRFLAIGTDVTLTSGTPAYPGSGAIRGADITLNNNPNAYYDLNFFRRLLTHEIGHAIGLGDVEGDINPGRFIDDDFDGIDSSTALMTLTNSWANQVDPQNPASSPLGVYDVPASSLGVGATGVDILMESRGLGIGRSNPVTDLFPLRNDDFGMRQFLYPSLTRVPEPTSMTLVATLAVFAIGRRSHLSARSWKLCPR